MPLRSGGRFARAKRGELEKNQALLPLLRPLLQSGSLRSVLETAVESASLSPTPSGKGVQRQKQENAEEGWKRVRQAKRANVDQPPPRDTLQQDGWSVRVENTLAGFRHAKEGIFLATVKEAKELMLEMHSSGSLAVLAPININEKGTEISVLVQDWNGRMQSRQRFLHQLGDVPVQYQSTAPQGGSVQDGGTSQIVLNLSKQYTDKQGWEAAELAPRTAARRWLQHRAGVEVFDVRPPTRVAGREELQVVAQIASSTYDRALRASGMDGVMTRPFYTTEKEKTQFRPVPLPLDFTLEGALRKTSWLAERAFGVVTTRLGLAVRVRTADFEEVMRLVQPENYTKFLGELWDVSGLPLSWGPEAVTDFLAGWKVSPVRTFRQGYRRTWVVRALEHPDERKTATRIRPCSYQALYCAKSKDKSRNSEMDAGLRAEENREKDSLPADLGSSGDSVTTTKGSGKQRTKTVDRDAGNVPAKQNSESEQFAHFDGSWGIQCKHPPVLQQ